MVELHRQGRTPTPDLANLATYHEIATKLDYEQVEAMGDAEYFATYQEALAERDANYPIPYDRRLWRAPVDARTRQRAAG